MDVNSVDINIQDIMNKKVVELYEIAKQLEIPNASNLKKKDLALKIVESYAEREGLKYVEGVLDIKNDGYGFIRKKEYNYMASSEDVYVSQSQIKKLGLRMGDFIQGFARPLKTKGEDSYALVKGELVNGRPWMEMKQSRLRFEQLTPYYPEEKFDLDIVRGEDYSLRIVDLFAPIGKGQRALIVSPPRAGKTVLLQNIANAIRQNHPDVELIVLLIDERPEEVTDFKKQIDADVISSTFDLYAERHTEVAEVVLERAKRLAELGKDVVILLDSITRLARAYNTITPHSGRTLTGGIDSTALVKPKKFFGAARNIVEGGSLTIIATALIETGSKMDEVIFEEFKGTGNCEIVLDRRLADRRIFPAIDLNKSGTRREELLLPSEVLNRVWVLRKTLSEMDPVAAMEFILQNIKLSMNNKEFLEMLTKKLRDTSDT